MSKKDEALKLALEALEGMYIEGFTQDNSPINNALTAIREALAEQPAQKQDEDAQCRCESSDWIPPDDYDGDGSVSAMARRTAQKQEPRGWQWLDTGVFRKKLPKTAEPNAWHALYTSPPASKPWVGLTDEEIQKEFHPLHATGLQFARAIEAKLRKKNA